MQSPRVVRGEYTCPATTLTSPCSWLGVPHRRAYSCSGSLQFCPLEHCSRPTKFCGVQCWHIRCMLADQTPSRKQSCRCVRQSCALAGRLAARLCRECGASAAYGHMWPACAVRIIRAGRLQELAVELVRLQLAEPDWNEAWGPYWRSLPPEGALGGKEAFDLSVIHELQDDAMARPCTWPGNSPCCAGPACQQREAPMPNMCAADHRHVSPPCRRWRMQICEASPCSASAPSIC